MRLEVAIWLTVNLVSLIASLHDLIETYRIWGWAKRNVREPDDRRISFRSFRLAAVRASIAFLFVLAGLLAVLSDRGEWLWVLIFAAVLLSIDVVMEARYRAVMFSDEREAMRNESSRRK